MPTFGRKVSGVDYRDRPGAYALMRSPDRQTLAVIDLNFGLFLPGGGLEGDETPEAGLARELREEIGYALVTAEYLGSAEQYHWSEFYQTHFRKIGSFFLVEATPPAVPTFQEDHRLIWLTPDEASRRLMQDFQRYGVSLLPESD